MESPSDAQLMAGVRVRDRTAKGQLIDRHKDALVGYLARLTGSRDRAEDFAQETFLNLFTRADRYTEQGKLRGFLYRIATNLALTDHRRRRRQELLRRVLLQNRDNHHPVPTPQGTMLRNEAQRKLGEALAQIPLRLRTPLVLHELEGLSLPEVAAVLGWREGTVKSRIWRGRRLLRIKLSPYIGGGEP